MGVHRNGVQKRSIRLPAAAIWTAAMAGGLWLGAPSPWAASTNAAAGEVAVSTVPAGGTPANPSVAAANDPAALKFMQACAGCHTFGGGKLTGPDLITASTWPKADLKTNLKRMEEKAGPLGPDLIELLAEFLKDNRVKDRLKAAEAEIARQYAAQLAPASALTGHRLFDGKIPLQNGGPACAACHSVDGHAKLLGPDLRTVHQRMGGTALAGAIQKANFKIMEPAFRSRPVTLQEAMHLACYLGGLEKAPPAPPAAPVAWLGLGLAVSFYAGLFAIKRRFQIGRRVPPRRRRP